MAARPTYAFSLGLTSQFYFCSLPLRLDSYSHCSFGCRYCFASARGGASRRRPLQVIDPDSLDRRLERVATGDLRSVVDQMLAQRQPVHFGGMSDPFLPLEARLGATKKTLAVLAEHDYPTIISTKGSLLRRADYLEILTHGRFLVQFSISSLDESLIAAIDHGTPSPGERLETMAELAAAGVPVATRIQPLLPGRETGGAELIAACADAGSRHVAVEHLKLPVERNWRGANAMSRALKLDLQSYYAEAGAIRVGREWLLPVNERLPQQLHFRRDAHRHGMSFAAADSDLLLLSDGGCCCSGADALPGFGSYARFNFLEAARRGVPGNRVSFDSISDAWRPAGTIARFVNSHSRLLTRNGTGAGIESYIRHNWNGSPNGCSPAMFWGIEKSGEIDSDGLPIYGFDPQALRLYRDGLEI